MSDCLHFEIPFFYSSHFRTVNKGWCGGRRSKWVNILPSQGASNLCSNPRVRDWFNSSAGVCATSAKLASSVNFGLVLVILVTHHVALEADLSDVGTLTIRRWLTGS